MDTESSEGKERKNSVSTVAQKLLLNQIVFSYSSITPPKTNSLPRRFAGSRSIAQRTPRDRNRKCCMPQRHMPLKIGGCPVHCALHGTHAMRPSSQLSQSPLRSCVLLSFATVTIQDLGEFKLFGRTRSYIVRSPRKGAHMIFVGGTLGSSLSPIHKVKK